MGMDFSGVCSVNFICFSNLFTLHRENLLLFCLGWNKFLICIAGRWNTTAKRPIFEILCKCWATISMCTSVSQSARLSVKSAIGTMQRVFIPIPWNRSLTRASLEDPQRFSICDNVNTRLCWELFLHFWNFSIVIIFLLSFVLLVFVKYKKHLTFVFLFFSRKGFWSSRFGFVINFRRRSLEITFIKVIVRAIWNCNLSYTTEYIELYHSS